MRLNRFLAAAGLGSRRGCELLIVTGRVTVNGQVCTDLATTVSGTDSVKADGHLIHAEERLYVLINKPAGYLCTRSDTHQRRTIFDLVPRNWPRLFHVGRLDMESEGLLLLTNDGDLTLKLTHPRYKIEKEYEVTLDRPFDATLQQKLLAGVRIEGGRAKADRIQRLAPAKLKVILRQGMKRQIRLMFQALDYEVKYLRRVRIGPLGLDRMRPGEWRFLTKREIELLSAREAVPKPRHRPANTRGSVPLGPRR